MREAVIVSYARTGLAKSNRGGFNNTHGAAMAGHAIQHAVSRAGLEGAEVEDVVLGCGGPEGATGMNVARNAAIWAGLPVTTSGQTVNRFCSSGLQAIATAANYVRNDGAPVAIGGGVESISLVQGGGHMNRFHITEEKLMREKPALWMAMIDTADIVAKRYNISREAQDEYSYEARSASPPPRPPASSQRDRPDGHPMKVVNKETKEESLVDYVVDGRVQPARHHPGRPGQALQPVKGPGKFVTAGNASQLSDGAAAVVVMEAKDAVHAGLEPLGAFRGFAVAGCEPDEMGIGPIYAVPRLLERHGLKVDDIDLWELNEAFASQCLYSRDKLGIDPEKYNVNGGSIAIGHPFGMTGARLRRPPAAGRQAPRRQAGRGRRCASAAAWARPACSRP
jgi:acetyl-CoA C-acetyltransferase